MSVATGSLDLLMGLFYLVALVALWPGPGLLAALVTGIMAVGALAAGRMAAHLEARRLEARVKEEGLMIELVGGIATLKAAGAEAQGLARWRTCFRDALALERTRGRIGLGTTTGLGGLSQALALGLFTLGGLRLLDGTLTIGRLFAFLQMTSGLLASAMSFVQALLTLMVLRPQLARTRELLEQEAEPRPPPIPAVATQARVALAGVWFRYGEASPWVLQDYHLELDPGRKTALAGPSGFGKTTVLRLLAGLHRPVRGSVLINGAPAAEARHSLIYLPQFVRVFGGSLLDNLRIFSCGAPLTDLLAMARKTGLQALVDTLPMGYRTLLPPGGRNLSGGQRQLLAITGALASGRPLLLLDEALANLDPHLGAAIQDIIEAGPWTVVSASHAPSRPDRPHRSG
jgi:ABC-type bacteriocin/lantibiotic exporter with double-glycine peptidase domain